MSLPAIADLDAYRRDSWSQVFRLTQGGSPVDLTGSTLVAAIRDPRTESEYALPVEVGPDPGEFTLRLPDPPPPPGHYRWDAQQTDTGGVVTTWLQGRFHLWRDVAPVAAPG